MRPLSQGTCCSAATTWGRYPALLAFAWSVAAAAQPLPEGNTGIASRHLGDVGIKSDSAVVFADDFEAITGTSLTAANSGWDNIYNGVGITTAAANVHAGAKAVEINLRTANAFGGWRDFGTNGYDTLFVRYYMKYHPSYPGVHHQGMTIFAGAPGVTTGSSTGVRPNGTNHFTVGLDNLNPRFSWSPPGNALPGYLYFYCYHMDQSSNYGDVFLPSGDYFMGQPALFGPTFVSRPRVIPPRAQWLSFELMVKSNTPGQRDGRIAFWVDGQLKADFPNLRLRTTAALKPNFVVLAPYSSEVLADQVLWYDDVVAATSYIGPMVPMGGTAGGSGGSAGGSGSAGSSGAAGGVGAAGGGTAGGSTAGGSAGGSVTTAGGSMTMSPAGGGAGGSEVMTGGCSASGGSALLGAVVLLLARRRRLSL